MAGCSLVYMPAFLMKGKMRQHGSGCHHGLSADNACICDLISARTESN